MIWLRQTLFQIYLVIFTFVLGILALPVLLFGENAVRYVNKLWCASALGALRIICGLSMQVSGEENLPASGALVAANHQSMWETIALYHLLPRPVLAFKQELARIPIYGWFASAAGNIAIDRNAGVKALRKLTKAASAKIADGDQVVVFPEGTRVEPGEQRHLKPGAAAIYQAAAAICVPVAHNSGTSWRGAGFKPCPGRISLKFLTPIAPGLDRKVFTATLEQALVAGRPDLAPSEDGDAPQ